ncbi:hypothetical protein FRC11_000760 [Ceratobasidium sp. 423]|nr:hypothetical protein FRC11_000760 [Ceratobasidium sp. 423]
MSGSQPPPTFQFTQDAIEHEHKVLLHVLREEGLPDDWAACLEGALGEMSQVVESKGWMAGIRAAREHELESAGSRGRWDRETRLADINRAIMAANKAAENGAAKHLVYVHLAIHLELSLMRDLHVKLIYPPAPVPPTLTIPSVDSTAPLTPSDSRKHGLWSFLAKTSELVHGLNPNAGSRHPSLTRRSPLRSGNTPLPEVPAPSRGSLDSHSRPTLHEPRPTRPSLDISRVFISSGPLSAGTGPKPPLPPKIAPPVPPKAPLQQPSVTSSNALGVVAFPSSSPTSPDTPRPVPGGFAALVETLKSEANVLSTSPGITFDAPNLIVRLAEKELDPNEDLGDFITNGKTTRLASIARIGEDSTVPSRSQTPTPGSTLRRPTGDEKAGLPSVLGWKGNTGSSADLGPVDLRNQWRANSIFGVGERGLLRTGSIFGIPENGMSVRRHAGRKIKTGKEWKGRGMCGVAGFVRHQGLTVLYAEYVDVMGSLGMGGGNEVGPATTAADVTGGELVGEPKAMDEKTGDGSRPSSVSGPMPSRKTTATRQTSTTPAPKMCVQAHWRTYRYFRFGRSALDFENEGEQEEVNEPVPKVRMLRTPVRAGPGNDIAMDERVRSELRLQITEFWKGIKDYLDELESYLETREANPEIAHKRLPTTPPDSDTETEDRPRVPRKNPALPRKASQPALARVSPTPALTRSASMQGSSLRRGPSPRRLSPLSTPAPPPPPPPPPAVAFQRQPSQSDISVTSPAPPPTTIPDATPISPIDRALLKSLRAQLLSHERELYDAVAHVGPGTFNDVRRQFIVQGRAAVNRIKAWEKKHVPEVQGSGTIKEINCQEPSWWGKDTHVVPGSDVIINEGDLGSIIAFTLRYDWTAGNRLKFSCTVYYARQFDAMRRRCGVAEGFNRSLAECANWLAEGGKSKSNFFKTRDDRYIIKSLVNAWNVADLQILIEMAPSYFRYIDSTHSKASVLAKMLGFYTIEVKNLETGATQTRADVLVMENLMFGRNITQTFDLKGIKGRKVKPGGKSGATLFDGEWIEGASRALLLVRPHSKLVLQEAVKYDAEFLAKSNIMDYSLLLGVDEEHSEIACGLVDTIGSYTFAKTLENKAKSNLQSGREVTVVPPADYQERFVKAMERYFLACPDKWSKPPPSIPDVYDPAQLPSVL